ncbi:hypothetical protein PVL29_009075 [Vitis rotundifolia]|uniref:Uncharacterized protein n=1 Tax=Vitis rotundifolia TaxID=103349 RepID=A0AA38ZXI7_VITRO|nr:hypothetical protein PVL29_009075 [Vitis rotundifolia]
MSEYATHQRHRYSRRNLLALKASLSANDVSVGDGCSCSCSWRCSSRAGEG